MTKSLASKRETKGDLPRIDIDIDGWINLLRSISAGDTSTNTYHIVAHTTPLLQSYGITGDVWIGRSTVNKRHSRDTAHQLTEEEWIEVLNNINDPSCITKYNKVEKGFRLYTPVIHDGENVCVGLEVRSIGRGIEISRITTVFARHRIPVENTETETVLYRKK